jgi:hypothetical protein
MLVTTTNNWKYQNSDLEARPEKVAYFRKHVLIASPNSTFLPPDSDRRNGKQAT